MLPSEDYLPMKRNDWFYYGKWIFLAFMIPAGVYALFFSHNYWTGAAWAAIAWGVILSIYIYMGLNIRKPDLVMVSRVYDRLKSR